MLTLFIKRAQQKWKAGNKPVLPPSLQTSRRCVKIILRGIL
jgi:hypothetical protein